MFSWINAVRDNSSSWGAKVPGQTPLPDCCASVYRAALPARRSNDVYRYKDPIRYLYFGSRKGALRSAPEPMVR